MKLYALKMKLEGFHNGRWYARPEFGIKYSDDLNKARLLTPKELREFRKYVEQAQVTYSFDEAWEVHEVQISLKTDS